METLGRYTAYDQLWIDEQINSQLHMITKTILEKVVDVYSVILFGGFGRGEGSVKIQDKEIIPLCDYDMLVVVNKTPSERIKRELYQKLYRGLRFGKLEDTLFRHSQFTVDITFKTKDKLTLVPDIPIYELKSASVLLYGEDVRKIINWTIEDVPPSSALRFLFEKVTGLIGHFSYEYLKGRVLEKWEKENIIYICNKTFLDIAAVLCFLMRRYEPTYVERMKVFSEHYKAELPELYEKLPDLAERVVLATKFKLKPDFNQIKDDSIDLWFTTRNYLGVVVKYCMKRLLNVESSDWIDFSEKARLGMWRHYLKPLIKNVMKKKLGIEHDKIVTISNILFQIVLNLQYVYSLAKFDGTIHLVPLIRPQCPAIKFYSAAPLILFSIVNNNGDLRREYLEKAGYALNYCVPINQNRKGQEWEYLKRAFLKAYYSYTGPR